MRVGVTGSFSSGKDTVCRMFEELGAKYIDTDIIAREIVRPGETAYGKIIEIFGQNYITADRTLDRKKLAETVFSDRKKLNILNSITHPEILKEVMKRTDKSDNIYVINTPLLFETGFNTYMDINITVVANDRLSVERGILRDGSSENEIKMRLKNQFSINKKIKLADYIIDNTESLQKTNIQVIELWKILNSLMNQK